MCAIRTLSLSTALAVSLSACGLMPPQRPVMAPGYSQDYEACTARNDQAACLRGIAELDQYQAREAAYETTVANQQAVFRNMYLNSVNPPQQQMHCRSYALVPGQLTTDCN